MTFECLVLLEGWEKVSLRRIKEEMQAGRVVAGSRSSAARNTDAMQPAGKVEAF